MDNYVPVYIAARRGIEAQYALVHDTRERQLAPYPEMFSWVNIFLLKE